MSGSQGLYSHGGPQNAYGFWRSDRWFRYTRLKQPSYCISIADSHPKATPPNGSWSLTLWWPYIVQAKEGINGRRHGNAALVAFTDGHIEEFADPDRSINPSKPGSNEYIEHWDPLQRYKP